MRLILLGAMLASAAWGQTCPEAASFRPCDMVFETAREVALDVEFRSPEYSTYKLPAFWNGKAMVVRFSPTGPGAWAWRATSAEPSLNGKTGEFMAADSNSSGFIRVDNVRAWSYTAKKPAVANREAHLWMGFQCPQCLTMPVPDVSRLAETRAAQHFNHATLTLAATDGKALDDAEARVRALWAKEIFTDIQFAASAQELAAKLTTLQAREAFARLMAARFAAFGVTWQGAGEFESGLGGRALLRDLGLALKKLDPYGHPRTTGAAVTSAVLMDDGWMTHTVCASPDDQLSSIESQTVHAPRISTERPTANFGNRLWDATISGQYPSFSLANEADAKTMMAWAELMGRTRYWELEADFDVDGGRALYLTGIEYIAYVPNGGTIDVLTEKKGYQVYWMNVDTGVIEKQKKDYKAERFSGQPPGTSANGWVLHLSRDGRKEGWAKSVYFESRRVMFQEVETNQQKVPFTLKINEGDDLKAGKPIVFDISLARESRATREMAYVLTAEATADDQGARVVAMGAKGDFTLPENIARSYPAVVNLRLLARNLNGKVYSVDRVVRVTK